MTPSTGHGLFFERRRPVLRSALSLGLTLCVLLLNSHTGMVVSLVCGGCGLSLLLIEYVRGINRIESTVTLVLSLVVIGLVANAVLNLETVIFLEVASRIVCGVIWVLWLGTQMDWVSLRQVLRYLRVPEVIVDSLDHAILHGIFTQREWLQRRDAVRVRMGLSTLSIRLWGSVLSEGVLQAFSRLEIVDQHSTLRIAPIRSGGMTQLMSLQTVSVKRGEKVVLEDLDFSVTSGEWILLCGPSGAGKSSLLRLIAGLDAPERGTLTRCGTVISSEVSLSDRLDGRVALLVQNPEHHFVASTVAEDIMWGLVQRDVDESEARTHCLEIAKSLRIEHLLHRPCHALSFGEQRRVALAGLIVLEPELLLLDEPTSGLDPVAAHELCALVKAAVSRTGSTCIWSTHDFHSAPSQAKRIILLNQGRILFDGPSEEGLSKPWLLRSGLAIS